ncbi:MAG: minor capsid protein [Bacteroidetes bacterium]|nr:minor capsid protein [Bacteroidota bacterium]
MTKSKETKKYTGGGFIAVSNNDKYMSTQAFKGQVVDIPVKFPRGLGAEHPFNFKDVENVYKKYGPLAEIINKQSDAIVTDFEVKLQNLNAQVIIDDFLHDTDFHTKTREWVREALLKGNGFMEIDLEETNIRVMNANNMYIKRNKKGKVIQYNQWTKPFKQFSRDSPDLIDFKPNRIAHLTINKIPNDPYGIGIVWPNENLIENIILNEQDLQKLISRKAGAPYHFKVGQPGTNIPTSVVDSISSSLQFLTNKTEWVTDGDVDIKMLDSSDVGKSLISTQEYFRKMMLAGLGIPEVVMGFGNIPEGLAKVQLETYDRRIKSIQQQVADIIEEKIIRPILRQNKLDEQPEFIWDLPSEEQISQRAEQIQNSLRMGSLISEPMKAALEIEWAKLWELEDLIKVLPTPKEALKKQEEREKQEQQAIDSAEREREEEEIPQPETPGVKPNANQMLNKIKKIQEDQNIEEGNITVKDWVNLKEIAGFNYSDYLTKILQVLGRDKFQNLRAITKNDVTNGLLTRTEVEKMRNILRTGFVENQTIRQIENELKTSLKFRDRKKDGKVIAVKAGRPNSIARTETVRLSNNGILNLYKENKIVKVRFLAALSDRTCPICEDLNGQIFDLNQAGEMIPVHTNCRCSWISVIEVRK